MNGSFGCRCSASPLPFWEGVGRLRRPFLEKDAEAKLRLRRIADAIRVRGYGLTIDLNPSPTLSHKGRGSTLPLPKYRAFNPA